MPQAKSKKPATPGKKEEKGDAKKPPQEKKDNAPAKAKKEGAPKQGAPKKKDAVKPAGDNKSKDQGKKRKLNETGQGKSKQGGADSKKKKVEKKVQGKGQKTGVGKKPVKKQLSARARIQKRLQRRRKLARRGRQEIVVYEGRRYFLLPNGHIRAMLDIKLEENDKVAKIDGVFIKKSDVKTFEEYKESVKNNPPSAVRLSVFYYCSEP